MTIEYFSRRREVMAWYWRTWTNNPFLLRIRFFIFAGAVLGFFTLRRSQPSAPYEPSNLVEVVETVGFGVAVLALLALYPILTFKPQKRVLSTTSEGITTTIGSVSGAVKWKAVADIRQEDSRIVIQNKNGNAFIVPMRAFANEEERQRFWVEAVAWFEAARSDESTSP